MPNALHTMTQDPGVKLETLRTLAAAGSVREALLVGHGRAWQLQVRYGMHDRPLVTRRGTVRRFKKLETAVALIREAGISRFGIDAADYDPAA